MDRLAREPVSEATRLRLSLLGESDARHPAAQNAVHQSVDGVSDKKKHRGHGGSMRGFALASDETDRPLPRLAVRELLGR
jgi:hypothetical protein